MEESWAMVVGDDEDLREGPIEEDESFVSLSPDKMATFLIDRIFATIDWIHQTEYESTSYFNIEDSLSSSDPKENNPDEQANKLKRSIHTTKRQLRVFVTTTKTGQELKPFVEGLFKRAYGDAIVEKQYKVGDSSVKSALVNFQNSAAADLFYGIVLFLLKEAKKRMPALPRRSFSSPTPIQADTKTFLIFISTTTSLLMRGVSKENIRYRVVLVKFLLDEYGTILQTQLPRTPDNIFFNLIRFLGDFDDPKYLCTGKLLGAGAVAKVFLGYNIKTGQPVAIKVMDTSVLFNKNPKLRVYLDNELRILATLNCDNIVRMLEVVREDAVLNVVLEYCGGGTLQDMIKERTLLPEKEALHWLRQLALAIKELRTNNIIHRDLKPANLLFTTDRSCLKITDFGFARQLDAGEMASSMVGTPLYVAPEIILPSPGTREYTEKADVWSVGVILFEMLTGRCPFDGENFPELIRNLKKNNVSDHPKYPSLSPGMQEFLSALLNKEYNLRMSWPEFFQHLSVDQRFCANCVDADQKNKELLLKVKHRKALLKAMKKKLEERDGVLEGRINKIQGENGELKAMVEEEKRKCEELRKEKEALEVQLKVWEKEMEDMRKKEKEKLLVVEEEEQKRKEKEERRAKKVAAREERQKAEKAALEQKDRKVKELEDRLKEEISKSERERHKWEAKVKEVQEILEKEKKEREEKEKKDKEEKEKRKKLKKEKKEREEKLKRENEERERKLIEEREMRAKEAKERKDREEKEERERKLQEEKERKEREERARKLNEEKDKEEREKKEKREREEKAKREAEEKRLNQERNAKEEKERKEKERNEQEKREKEEKERKVKEEREKVEREEIERRERQREECRAKMCRASQERQEAIDKFIKEKEELLALIDKKLARKINKELSAREVENITRLEEQEQLDHLFALELEKNNGDKESEEYKKKVQEMKVRREKADKELVAMTDKREGWRKKNKKQVKTLKRQIKVLQEVEKAEQQKVEEWEKEEKKKEEQERMDASLALQLEEEEKRGEGGGGSGCCGGGGGADVVEWDPAFSGGASIVINPVPPGGRASFIIADLP